MSNSTPTTLSPFVADSYVQDETGTTVNSLAARNMRIASFDAAPESDRFPQFIDGSIHSVTDVWFTTYTGTADHCVTLCALTEDGQNINLRLWGVDLAMLASAVESAVHKAERA
jgi:hypothetical protein